jgi:hypothetical protein
VRRDGFQLQFRQLGRPPLAARILEVEIEQDGCGILQRWNAKPQSALF